MTLDLSTRRPETQRWGARFDYSHLSPALQLYSMPFQAMAEHMISTVSDSPDLTVALRKLWELKNDFVMIGVEQEREKEAAPAQAAAGDALPMAQDTAAQCCRSSS